MFSMRKKLRGRVFGLNEGEDSGYIVMDGGCRVTEFETDITFEFLDALVGFKR